MKPLSNILVVDSEDMTRSLITRALLRRFPDAVVQQCGNRDAALHAAESTDVSDIVAHGAVGVDPTDLVSGLRAANGEVPIILMSRTLSHDAATAAGADYLLDPENWIRISDILPALHDSPSRNTNAIRFADSG